jgi:thiol-disulfide isomerase/thioredoxin
MNEDDEILVAVWVMAVVAIFTLCAPSPAQDHQANAAAAIAITDAPKGKPIPAKAQSKVKPVVRFYTASWCKPCQVAKAELAKVDKSQLPFEIVEVDISDPDAPRPTWCKTIPSFAWEVEGWERYTLGYSDAKNLEAIWRRNQYQYQPPAATTQPTIKRNRLHGVGR